MEIERISPDDWEHFRTVRLASLLDAPSAFGSRFEDWVDACEERWRARLVAVPLNLIAYDGAQAVGVVSGQPRGEGWVELISMWVDPSTRGTGVTGDLIAAVVAWAAAQGRSTCLMVRGDNARARTAYQRAGFVDRGVPEGWPSVEPPEHRMELSL